MLWYKAWLETRGRFLIALFGITAFCAYSVFHGDKEALSDTRIEYYYHVLHSGHKLLTILWVVAVNLLMMGGLLREKSVGASAYTLALPVSRARLMGVRVSFGFIQAISLVIVPWCAMFLVSSIFGKTHSVPQALFHIILLTGGGMVFFAIALLTSSLVEGEYTAPCVSFGIAIALGIIFNAEPLRAYNPWAFISGSYFYNRQSFLLAGPIPWMQVMAYFLFAAILTFISIKAVQKHEF